MLTGDISAAGRWFADLNQIKVPLIISADGRGHMKMSAISFEQQNASRHRRCGDRRLQIMSVLKASLMSFSFFLNTAIRKRCCVS